MKMPVSVFKGTPLKTEPSQPEQAFAVSGVKLDSLRIGVERALRIAQAGDSTQVAVGRCRILAILLDASSFFLCDGAEHGLRCRHVAVLKMVESFGQSSILSCRCQDLGCCPLG
jgi:hypothetical protein